MAIYTLIRLYIALFASVACSHALIPRYINAPAGKLGEALDGPATGKGTFYAPKEDEVWYVGETKQISWTSEDNVDTSRARDDSGFITLGWLLYRYPDTDFASKADYDVKDRLWNLKENEGTYDWIVNDSCLDTRCYFSFHYFIKNGNGDGPYAFFYSKNFTVKPKPEIITVTQVAPTATVTVGSGANKTPDEVQEEKSVDSGSGGGSSSVGKIVGPIVGVIGALAIIGAVLFFWRKRKRSQQYQLPGVPPPPPEYGRTDNAGYTPNTPHHHPAYPTGAFEPQKVELEGTNAVHELPAER